MALLSDHHPMHHCTFVYTYPRKILDGTGTLLKGGQGDKGPAKLVVETVRNHGNNQGTRRFHFMRGNLVECFCGEWCVENKAE